MSANPIANGGLLRRPLDMPDFRQSAVKVEKPGATLAGNVPTLGNFLREVTRLNTRNFRVFGPDWTQSNKLEALYDVTKKVWLGEYFPEDADGGELAPEGRVMEMLSEHTVEGWPVAGWGLHPLESAAFSRRTRSAAIANRLPAELVGDAGPVVTSLKGLVLVPREPQCEVSAPKRRRTARV